MQCDFVAHRLMSNGNHAHEIKTHLPLTKYSTTFSRGGPLVDDVFSTVLALDFDVCMISTRSKLNLTCRNY